MDRAVAATAYTRRITKLVGHLARSGLEVTHPLLEPRPEVKRAVLLVLTANRGLCGGYNGSVLRLANARYRELRDAGVELRLEVAGKRGISAFRFRKIKTDEAFTHFNDKPSFAEVDVLASRYLADFTAGAFDRLDVVYTKFESASRQQAVAETLLPLGGLEGAEEEMAPRRAAIRVPAIGREHSRRSRADEFPVKLFKCFLDAAVSEQIARMVAMKAATENADSMISQPVDGLQPRTARPDHRGVAGDHRRSGSAQRIGNCESRECKYTTN